MENPIIILLYWFESFCLIAMGGILFNYFSHQTIPKILLASFINSMFLYFIRNLLIFAKIPVNLHIIITILFSIIIFTKIGGMSWTISCTSVILGYAIVIFNEMSMLLRYLKWFNIPVDKISTNVYVHLKAGFISDITLLVVISFILIIKYFFKLGVVNHV